MIALLRTACGCERSMNIERLMPVIAVQFMVGRPYYATDDRSFSGGMQKHQVRRFMFEGPEPGGSRMVYRELVEPCQTCEKLKDILTLDAGL